MAQPSPPGWYTDPQDPSRNMYWDGRAWHRNGAPPVGSPVIINTQKRSGCMSAILIGLALLLGSCIVGGVVSMVGSSDKKDSSSSSRATSSSSRPPLSTAPPTNAENTTVDPRPAPTDEQVKQAFQAYIDERAQSGVMLAQAVTSVTVQNGVVTVTLDASPTLIELSPFDNLAEFFGSPVKFNNDESTWLRRTVQRVDVVDAQGNSLGSMTAAELNRRSIGG